MSRLSRLNARKNRRDNDDDDDDFFDDNSRQGLRGKGIYYISGCIGESSLKDINEDLVLKHMTSSWRGDIQFIINSPGGVLSEGWPLIDLFNWIRMDIRTIGIGEISSLATMLVAAGTPGKRFVTPNTSIMLHNFSSLVHGKYTDIVAGMKSMEDENARVLRFWKQNSKYKTDKAVEQNLMKSTDLWLTPQEALEHGIIDGIAGKI